MSELSYGDYLHLDKLLSCQTPLTEAHDELQFIVVHQVFELWFRLLLHEMTAVLARLGEGDPAAATRSLRRIHGIVQVFPRYLGILETMRPADFHRFREALGSASGLQSEQFRELEILSGLAEDPSYVEFLRSSGHWTDRLERRLGETNLRGAIRRTLEGRGITPEEVYTHPEDHAEIHDLLEACLDYDEGILAWRFAHLQLVERVIGSGVAGTGGMGAPYLERTLKRRFFPDLWKARDPVTLAGGGGVAGREAGGEH